MLHHLYRPHRKSPVFWLGIVLTLGVALAATALVFTLLNGFLLRPMPYANADRIAVVYEYSRKAGPEAFTRVPFANALSITESASAFSRVGIVRNESTTVHGPDSTEVAYVQRVTPDVFPLLGVQAQLGQIITPATAELNGERTVMLTDSLWRRRFGANPAVIGRSVQFDDLNYRVIGVLPAGFALPSGDDDPQAFLAIPPNAYLRDDRFARRHHVFAELAPGRSFASAQAELDQLAGVLAREFPDSNTDRAFRVVPLREDLLGGVNNLLLMLQAAVTLVLLVACLNCLCLLVARVLQRRRELAVRLALGASRRHLFIQMFGEALGLTLPAAALALGLASLTLPALLSAFPPSPQFRAIVPPGIDAHVIGALLAAALGISLVFSLVPLAQSRGLNIESALRDGGRQIGSARGQRLTRLLAGAQITISLALLVCSLLLLRSQSQLGATDPGFDLAKLDHFRVGLRGTAYDSDEERLRFYDNFMRELRALPGIEGVSAINFFFIGGNAGGRTFIQESDGLSLTDSPKRAFIQQITPEFFDTIGLGLLGGRAFTALDDAAHPPVGIISASLARKYWPNGDAIGRRLQTDVAPGGWIEIVGIAHDRQGMGHRPRPIDAIYVPFPQLSAPVGTALLLRMNGPNLSRDLINRTLWRLDPDLAPFAHGSATEYYANASMQLRLMTLMVGVFGALAFLLALGGVYAVNAFRVAQRIPEFGVRLAFGASAAALQGLVLRENLRLTAWGIAAGLVIAVAGGFALQTFLYRISPLDPLAYAGGIAAMVLAGSIAALGPARRASRVDPLAALRAE